MEQAIQSVQSFFKRKDVVISAHRYGIDAMGAMAQRCAEITTSLRLKNDCTDWIACSMGILSSFL